MKPRSQDQSSSDSRELDRSYDPLTGTCPDSNEGLFTDVVLTWLQTAGAAQVRFGHK